MERWERRLKDGRLAILRRATEDDARALLDNINEVGAEEDWILTESVGTDVAREREWIRGFDGRRSVLYVAEVGGRVVGQVDGRMSSFRKARHIASLGIAIIREYRGLGIGEALMERVLAWMRDRGVEKACLEVFSTNEPAIALYRKLGFEEEGRKRRHFRIRETYVDDVMMAKWL